MKRLIIGLIAAPAIIFTSCNSGSEKKTSNAETSRMDTVKHAEINDTTSVTEVSPTFTSVDPKVVASIKEIVNRYEQIENGLFSDNGKDAANAGDAMFAILKKVDRSLFTAEQKKVYDDIEDDLEEHAEHIGENSKNIAHQREHFALMSEDVYDLVKAFGAGEVLYQILCPMYNKDKGGAIWLSEIKEIKNPYFGNEMPKCGTVKEMIK